MIVYRYREVALGIILPDDVLVEEGLDFLGLGQFAHIEAVYLPTFLLATHRFACNLLSLLSAFVTDVSADAGDEHAYFSVGSSAETAVLSLLLLCHYFLFSTWSIIPYSFAS